MVGAVSEEVTTIITTDRGLWRNRVAGNKSMEILTFILTAKYGLVR